GVLVLPDDFTHPASCCLLLSRFPHPPRSTLFPYTTLFRSYFRKRRTNSFLSSGSRSINISFSIWITGRIFCSENSFPWSVRYICLSLPCCSRRRNPFFSRFRTEEFTVCLLTNASRQIRSEERRVGKECRAR